MISISFLFSCSPAQAAWFADYTGTLGEKEIGLTLNHNTDLEGQVTGGHYYYNSWQKDILLKLIHQDGKILTFEESGDGKITGTVELSFPKNDDNYLHGTWISVDGARKLPITVIAGDGIYDYGNGSRYGKSSGEDKKTEANIRQFQKVVSEHNKQQITSYVSFPFYVNKRSKTGTHWKVTHSTIKDDEDFLKKYDFIFTSRIVNVIKNSIPHDLFVRDGQIAFGPLWFDPNGKARTINLSK